MHSVREYVTITTYELPSRHNFIKISKKGGLATGTEQFTRTAWLLGKDGIDRLHRCHVAVFGLGGVGGTAAEALARAGVGTLSLIDHDTVDITNLNRQAFAVHSTVGLPKTEAAARRLRDINPDLALRLYPLFWSEETAAQIDWNGVDYIADAIDTVSGKLLLAQTAQRLGIPLISSMGTGNKQDPSKLCVADVFETSGCPLARVMRAGLRKAGIDHLKTVWSSETPIRPDRGDDEKRSTPGSTPFVPPAAGLMMAAEIVRELQEGTLYG